MKHLAKDVALVKAQNNVEKNGESGWYGANTDQRSDI
jgi:hypothetical protein